ncbi:hypothetical protein ACLNGM_10190 [Aureimonas phyllosphaerae]|uniref:hypothetical protein n=1 Tax=Aureimonas phyllosphaerae TaxID=1166078 RepID=UPI003A5C1218
MIGAFEAIKAAIAVVFGVMLGWAASALYAETVSLPAAREAGRAEERIVHEEQRRKAEARIEADRRAAQLEIDTIERRYHERAAVDAARVSALEAAIDQEDARVQALPQAAPQARAGACRPAVPRGLRDALDPIGRAEARDHPAGPPAAMR